MPLAVRRRRSPAPRKTSVLSVRVEPALADALRRSAGENGKTLSDETAERLQGSLDSDRLSQLVWGTPELKAVFQMCGLAVREIESTTGKRSFDDPDTYLRAEQAVLQVFRQFAPKNLAEFEAQRAPEVGPATRLLLGDTKAPHEKARQSGAFHAMLALHIIASQLRPAEARDVRRGLKKLTERLPHFPTTKKGKS